MTHSTSFEKTLYVAEIPNDGMAWFLCLDHARSFADEYGLEWHNSCSFDYTEDYETKGATVWEDVFGQVETDYPMGCDNCDLDRNTPHITWLGNQLTPDGVQYLLDPENNFDDAVIEFYGYTKDGI